MEVWLPLLHSSLKPSSRSELAGRSHFGTRAQMRGVVQVVLVVVHSNSKGETMTMTQLILVKRAPKASDKSKVNHSISKSRNSRSNKFAKCTTISLAQSRLAFTHRRMRMITNSIAGSIISPSSQPTRPAKKTEANNRTTTTTMAITIKATTTTKAIVAMAVVAETITDNSRFKETSNKLRITKVKQGKYKCRPKE